MQPRLALRARADLPCTCRLRTWSDRTSPLISADRLPRQVCHVSRPTPSDGCSAGVPVPNRPRVSSNRDVSQKPVSPSAVPTGGCQTFLGQSSLVSAVFGHLRVSGTDQVLDLQRDALVAAGCTWVWDEVASGAKKDRPELLDLLFRRTHRHAVPAIRRPLTGTRSRPAATGCARSDAVPPTLGCHTSSTPRVACGDRSPHAIWSSRVRSHVRQQLSNCQRPSM